MKSGKQLLIQVEGATGTVVMATHSNKHDLTQATTVKLQNQFVSLSLASYIQQTTQQSSPLTS